MKPYFPYPECEKCKDIGDCAHPDVGIVDGLSLPMPPNDCQKPIQIMKATVKKRKLKNYRYGLS